MKDATWIHMKFQESIKETKDAEHNSIGTKHCNICVSEYRTRSEEKPKQEKHWTEEESPREETKK
eukprot:2011667-Karenia_brevis.AAC.1